MLGRGSGHVGSGMLHWHGLNGLLELHPASGELLLLLR